MTFTIVTHRGTHQIGGSCIEIATEKSRILLDFGMPLQDRASKWGRIFVFAGRPGLEKRNGVRS